MGCDIRAVIEFKDISTGKWSVFGGMNHDTDDGGDYISPNNDLFGRNYDLFAVLANVRNGYGFAGVNTGDPIVPISDPRGVPNDASDDYKTLVAQWGCDGHSHSFHTLQQILDFDWTQPKVSRGWVDFKTYAWWALFGETQGNSPREWCSDVEGTGIRKLIRAEADAILAIAPTEYTAKNAWMTKHYNCVYVYCEWGQPIAKSCGGTLWVDAIAPMLNLSKRHGGNENVRLVFFFDN